MTIVPRHSFPRRVPCRCSLGGQQRWNLRSRREAGVWSFDPLSRRRSGEMGTESERASGERRRRAGGKANSNLTNEKVSRKSDASKLARLWCATKGVKDGKSELLRYVKKSGRKREWERERVRGRERKIRYRSLKRSLCVGAKGMEKEERGRVESSFSLCSRNWLKSNGEEIQRDSWKSCFEFCGDRCAMENFSFPSSVSKTMETKGASFERETKPWSRIFLYNFFSLSSLFLSSSFPVPPFFLFSSFKGGNNCFLCFMVGWFEFERLCNSRGTGWL